jgi:hypothetical protein
MNFAWDWFFKFVSNIPVLVFRAPKAHASHHKHHKEKERVGEADSEKGSKKA